MNKLKGNITIEIFGSSHGDYVGGSIKGLPIGFSVNVKNIQKNLKQRHIGYGSTKRNDTDEFVIYGIKENKVVDKVVKIYIANNDVKSSDYNDIKYVFRPSHADYTNLMKYGEIIEGGGMSSGRMTAVIVALGTIAYDFLKDQGIKIESHIYRVGNAVDYSYLDKVNVQLNKEMPVINKGCISKIKSEINKAIKDNDSVGGIVETKIEGNILGIGEPFFDSIESNISKMMFSIPAVKGIEFGKGFDLAKMRGSKANDEFVVKNKQVRTKTNNNGGINGGIANGEPIIFKTAIKPTPSISKTQNTIDINKKEVKINIKGRHDACIAVRCPIIITMATSLVILDYLLKR